MSESGEALNDKNEDIIQEIVSLEREYYFEKKNAKTERHRKLRELIERRTKLGGATSDS